jgi:Na+-driven multidrug efflux pump
MDTRMQRPSLTEGSISRGLFKFALPILFANVLQSLNGSVNSIWVGRYLGEAALTATSTANMIMFLLIAMAFGVALATSIIVGQSIGANNMAHARKVVGTSATFFVGISVTMAITGLLICQPLLVAMKAPADSLPLAVTYLRVMFLATPILYMYAFVMSTLRGAGDSKTPFYFMLLSQARRWPPLCHRRSASPRCCCTCIASVIRWCCTRMSGICCAWTGR